MKENHIEYEASKKNNLGILGCLDKIDRTDIIYVVNPQGYVGKSVAVDLGYAYAKNKPIYVMEPVDDPPIMNLTKGTISPRKLIELLKTA